MVHIMNITASITNKEAYVSNLAQLNILLEQSGCVDYYCNVFFFDKQFSS